MRREIKCMRRKVRIAGGVRNYVYFPQYNNGNYETAAVRTLHGRCGKEEPAGRRIPYHIVKIDIFIVWPSGSVG